MTRANTLGIHTTNRRTLFQWTADGKLQEVVVNVSEEKPEPKKPGKFGIWSKNIPDGKSILSGLSGALSVKSGNTEVAFSEQDYPCGQD